MLHLNRFFVGNYHSHQNYDLSLAHTLPHQPTPVLFRPIPVPLVLPSCGMQASTTMEWPIHPTPDQPDDYFKVMPSQYPQFLTPHNEIAVAPEGQTPPPSSAPLLAQQSQAHSTHSAPPLAETDDVLPNTVSASLVAREKVGEGKHSHRKEYLLSRRRG